MAVALEAAILLANLSISHIKKADCSYRDVLVFANIYLTEHIGLLSLNSIRTSYHEYALLSVQAYQLN
jgi:hypothetical protein